MTSTRCRFDAVDSLTGVDDCLDTVGFDDCLDNSARFLEGSLPSFSFNLCLMM